jgi:hypothetical protein
LSDTTGGRLPKLCYPEVEFRWPQPSWPGICGVPATAVLVLFTLAQDMALTTWNLGHGAWQTSLVVRGW